MALRCLNAIFKADPLIDEVGYVFGSRDEGGASSGSATSFLHDAGEHKLGIVGEHVSALYSDFFGAFRRNKAGPMAPRLSRLGRGGDGSSDSDEASASHLLEEARAVLLLNPDCTTAWNTRKRHLISSAVEGGRGGRGGVEAAPAARALKNELRFLDLVFTQHPKKNDAWVHRRWVVDELVPQLLRQRGTAAEREQQQQQQQDGEGEDELLRALEHEFRICEKAARDYPRNYFAWTHRILVGRHLVMAGPVALQAEVSRLTEWCRLHVSDHSGFHCLQQAIDRYLRSGGGGTSFNCATPLPLIAAIKFLRDQRSALTAWCDRYEGHETLWYHRRFLVGRLITAYTAYSDGAGGRSRTAALLEEEIALVAAKSDGGGAGHDGASAGALGHAAESQLAATHALWLGRFHTGSCGSSTAISSASRLDRSQGSRLDRLSRCAAAAGWVADENGEEGRAQGREKQQQDEDDHEEEDDEEDDEEDGDDSEEAAEALDALEDALLSATCSVDSNTGTLVWDAASLHDIEEALRHVLQAPAPGAVATAAAAAAAAAAATATAATAASQRTCVRAFRSLRRSAAAAEVSLTHPAAKRLLPLFFMRSRDGSSSLPASSAGLPAVAATTCLHPGAPLRPPQASRSSDDDDDDDDDDDGDDGRAGRLIVTLADEAQQVAQMVQATGGNEGVTTLLHAAMVLVVNGSIGCDDVAALIAAAGPLSPTSSSSSLSSSSSSSSSRPSAVFLPDEEGATCLHVLARAVAKTATAVDEQEAAVQHRGGQAPSATAAAAAGAPDEGSSGGAAALDELERRLAEAEAVWCLLVAQCSSGGSGGDTGRGGKDRLGVTAWEAAARAADVLQAASQSKAPQRLGAARVFEQALLGGGGGGGGGNRSSSSSSSSSRSSRASAAAGSSAGPSAAALGILEGALGGLDGLGGTPAADLLKSCLEDALQDETAQQQARVDLVLRCLRGFAGTGSSSSSSSSSSREA